MPLIPVGRAVPNFTLADEVGKSHSLADYRGRPVVLFFYQEDHAPACTEEACQFRDHLAAFRKIKCVVLGASPDSEDSHLSFREAHDLGLTLLSDLPGSDGVPRVCEALGAWGDGPSPRRGVRRTTYLIGPDGKVKHRWDRVSVHGHAREVLEACKALHRGESMVDIELKPKAIKAPRARKSPGRGGDSNPPLGPVRVKVTKAAARQRSVASPRKARAGVRGKAK